MKNKITKAILAVTLLFSVSLSAQTTRLYATKSAPARTPARTTNNVQVYSGSGGLLQSASCIGYLEGTVTPGTLVPSDTSAIFFAYGNFISKGGVSYQYKVDTAATKFYMQKYANIVDFKHATTGDSIFLPLTSTIVAGQIFTIKNSSASSVVIVGSTRAEYIDTVKAYTLTTKKVLNVIYTGLSAPTGTVAATNKLNPSFIIR